MQFQGKNELKTNSPPQEVMDKNLKVGEDEWREKERGTRNFERKEEQ